MKYTSLTHYAKANIQQDWETTLHWEQATHKDDEIIWSVLFYADTGRIFYKYTKDASK